MRLVFFASICAVSASCGGPDCSKSDRSGTYLMRFSESSGNCGPIADGVVTFDNSGAGLGCAVDFERWSDGNCKLERGVTCDSPGDNQRLSVTAVTEQQDDDGKEISGTATYTVTNLSTGASVCVGTYDVTANRQ